MAFNSISMIMEQIHTRSDQPALWFADQGWINFDELGKRLHQVQLFLKRHGIQSGDAILLFDRLGADLYAQILGCAAMGVTVVLIEPWMALSRIQEAVLQIKPKAFLTNRTGRLWGLRVPAIRQIPQWFDVKAWHTLRTNANLPIVSVDPALIAILTFTSGTSGKPKGVPRSHGYLFAQAKVFLKEFAVAQHEGPDLCIFANFALANLAAGRPSLLLQNSTSPRAWHDLRALPTKHLPRTTTLNPASLRQMLKCGELLSYLEEVHVGGALVDCRDFEIGLKKVPRAKWLMVYGSTEAEPVSTGDAAELVSLSRQQGFIQTLCLGKKIDDIILKVEQDHLWVKGQHVCPGYFANPEADRENKRRDDDGSIWHNMGDRIWESDGFLWFRGRSTQSLEDFLLEQEIYYKLDSSDGFLAKAPTESHRQVSAEIDRVPIEHKVFYHLHPDPPRKHYPALTFVRVKRIYRDARHQSRIERQRTQERSTRMNRWICYLKERFPLSSYALLSAGFALAPLGYLSLTPFAWTPLLISFLGAFFFFVILRGMDEIKDVDKDRVANPTRPLPRGLISLSEARIFMISCYGVGTIVTVYLSPNSMSKMWYAFTMFYLGLMYFEFFVGTKLEKRPLLYALTHQVITLPLVLFTGAVWSGQVFSWDSFFYATTVFGAFFSYEIARKLDPGAHQALKTYRHVYGLGHCLLVTAALLIVSSWSAWQIGIGPLSALSGSLFFLTYLLMYYGKLKHKMVEIFATLNLLFHLFAPLSQLIHSATPK